MNVVGGYVVTDRMLEMFKSDKSKKSADKNEEPSNGYLAEVLSNPLGVVEWFVYLLAAVLFVVGLH